MPTAPKTKATSPPASETLGLTIAGDAAVLAAVRDWLAMLAPRPKPKLSEFMSEHARDDTGAPITPFPFQLDMADAFTDPETERLSCRKSSRIGYSTVLQSFVAWRIRYDPARTLIYQPTIDDAEKFSRDDLDPVLQWDVVREVATFKPRHADNQIRAKRYKGGWIQIKGANSPKEFRRVTADDVFQEECDGYPHASKDEGDPGRLADKRNLTSPRRFNAAGSTPKVKGTSRIDKRFEEGSQEYRYVPCPHCGEMQTLQFGDGTGAGLRWEPKKNPTRAWYKCINGCDIDESHKGDMDAAGEWRPHNKAAFPRHRSFHIWAAYSQHPGAAWLEIAREFVEVRGDPNQLRTFVNQVLGEAWVEKGEAPEWERIYLRRDRTMLLDTPPPWVGLLVGSVDVQRGSGGQGWLKFSVWGFGSRRRRVLVHSERIEGAASDPATWTKLDEAIAQTWQTSSGRELRLTRCAIDTGDGASTMAVYTWARRHPGMAMAVKGRPSVGVNQAISSPTWQDITVDGRKVHRRAVKLWNVGTAMLKLELYGLLGLPIPPKDEPEPDGWVYLPDDVTEDIVKELVAEQLVQVNKRKGGGTEHFVKVQERNEELDNAVYARAVAISLGVDRWKPAKWATLTGERTRISRLPRRPPPTDQPIDGVEPAPATETTSPKRKRAAAGNNPLTGRSRGSFLRRR